VALVVVAFGGVVISEVATSRVENIRRDLRQRLLNRWTSQLDLECTTGGLERVVSVHNSTKLWCPVNL
jgi:hypothetical protein